MPPNLGGFFMVRSYYPSECHADYFDFERIEALKPAIEACGISTLSQSPMLGFHKQMDNRIKLLEEILSFRIDRKSGSAGMPRPISYAVFCLKKKKRSNRPPQRPGRAHPGRPAGLRQSGAGALVVAARDSERARLGLFFNVTATTEIYTLSLHDALPIFFLNPQCLASISRWITASSSWKRFCLFVCRALSSIMVICMLTAIRLLLTFVMSLYLLLRS